MIYANDFPMTDLRLGETPVSAVYLGEILIWRPEFFSYPETVHFAANGDDMLGNGTIGAPLKSLALANQIPREGKTILFRGGDTFEGTLHMAPNQAASSYGSGKARIASGMGEGALSVNCPNSVITNLEFEGAGITLNPTAGIRATNNLDTSVFLPGLVIEDCIVHEYGDDGIRVSARNAPSGFLAPRINRNVVHDCVGNTRNGHTGGIIVYAVESEQYDEANGKELWGIRNKPASFVDVEVRDNHVYRCLGTPGTPNHSGNGIIIAQTLRGVMEGNLVEDCGHNNTSQAGPVAAWTWDSIEVVLRRNVALRQGSNGPDGGGFDLDGGCVDCLLEYNVCMDCAGPGILLYAFNDKPFWPQARLRDFMRNTARYNISIRCGAGGFSKYGIFLGTGRPVGSDWKDCLVYNNTIVTDNFQGTMADCFVVYSYDGVLADHLTGIVTNNIFLQKGDGLMGDVRKNRLVIEGNVYSTTQGRPMRYYGFDWQDFADFVDSSSTDGPPKEFLRNAVSAYERDPMFINDSSDNPADYQPVAGSPMWGMGIDITREYGLSRPAEDFLGNPINLPDRKFWTPGAIECLTGPVNRLADPNNLAGAAWVPDNEMEVVPNQMGMTGQLTAQLIRPKLRENWGDLVQLRTYSPGSKRVRRGAFVKSFGVEAVRLTTWRAPMYDSGVGAVFFDLKRGLFVDRSADVPIYPLIKNPRIMKRADGWWLVMYEFDIPADWTSDYFGIAPAGWNLNWNLVGNGWDGLIVDGVFEYLV